MSKASKPDKQNGTPFADSIRASSLKRLHRQAGQKTAPDQCQYVNLALAMREPSTEDIAVTLRYVSNSGHPYRANRAKVTVPLSTIRY